MKQQSGSGAFSLLAFLLVAACATTPEAPAQAQVTEHYSAEATVLAVNKATREVTLQRPDGASMVVVAGPGVRNFDQIEAGKTINARCALTLSVRRLGPDELDMEPAVALAEAHAMPGEKPAGAIGASSTMTVLVKSVDHDQHLVVFTDPDGVLHTVQAELEEGRRFVDGLKAGDRVVIVYSEAVALALQ